MDAGGAEVALGELVLAGLDSFGREPVSIAAVRAPAIELFRQLHTTSRKRFFALKPRLLFVSEAPPDGIVVTPTKQVGQEFHDQLGQRVTCARNAADVGRTVARLL